MADGLQENLCCFIRYGMLYGLLRQCEKLVVKIGTRQRKFVIICKSVWPRYKECGYICCVKRDKQRILDTCICSVFI
jgi:hypothetical protein